MMYGFDLEKVMALPKDEFKTVWEIFKSHNLEPVPAVTIEDAHEHEKIAVAMAFNEALTFSEEVQKFTQEYSSHPGDDTFDADYEEYLKSRYGTSEV